jgi:hypothetical protein
MTGHPGLSQMIVLLCPQGLVHPPFPSLSEKKTESLVILTPTQPHPHPKQLAKPSQGQYFHQNSQNMSLSQNFQARNQEAPDIPERSRHLLSFTSYSQEGNWEKPRNTPEPLLQVRGLKAQNQEFPRNCQEPIKAHQPSAATLKLCLSIWEGGCCSPLDLTAITCF